MNAIAGKGDAQSTLDKKITVEFKNIPLKEAVAKLGQCIPGLSFTYVESGALNEGRVNLSAKDEKASDVLNQILSPFSFNYTVMQYHIIIWFDAGKDAKRSGDAAINRLRKTPRIACVTGMVANLAMGAISGVKISFSEGTRTSVSDSLGGFKIRNIATDAILVFRAKGYKAQQVRAKAAAEGFLLVQLAKDGGAMQVPPLHK
jgi:hypothetical protein